MSSLYINNVPSWLVQPTLLQNVFQNPFHSLKDVSSFTSLDNSSQFQSGLRQALFWRRRLSPSASNFTVIFSFLGHQGLIIPNIPEVCQALREVCNIDNISEIYRPSNSHFIGITFSSSSDASSFRSSFIYYSNCLVVHVPTSTHLVHSFKLQWLPPAFQDTRIHHFLQKHSISHSFSRDVISTGPNTFSPTNSVTGLIQIAPDKNINLIPHLIPLPSPHVGHALLIISGRASLCLQCGLTGHVRRTCPAPRCPSCHYHHLKSSPCNSRDPVYALSSSEDQAFDDHKLNNPLVLPHDITSSSTTPVLNTASPAAIPSPHDSTINVSLPTIAPPLQQLTYNQPQFKKCDRTFSSNLDDLSSKTSSTLVTGSLSSHQESVTVSSNISTSTLASQIFESSHKTPVSTIVVSKSAKRSRPPPALNNTSTLESAPKRTNLFSYLPDELDTMHNVSSCCHPSSSNNTPPESSSVLDTSPGNLQPNQTMHNISISDPLTTLSTFSTGHDSAHSHLIDDAPSSALPPDADRDNSTSSWADQVEIDSPLSNSSPKDHINTTTESQIKQVLSDNNDDADVVELIIVGFHYDTNVDIILEFLGLPPPIDVFVVGSPDVESSVHHTATFHTLDDAQGALAKDGHWHGPSIISVSVKIDLDSSS